jgi:hypothetical protein
MGREFIFILRRSLEIGAGRAYAAAEDLIEI